MKLHWNSIAYDQLQEIRDKLAETSPKYAQQLADELIAKSQELVEQPRMGRMLPESNLPQVREVFVGKYRMIYCVGDFQVEILAIFHQAQRR